MKLRIKKGFDIPIEGTPVSSELSLEESQFIGVDFRPFSQRKIKSLVKENQFIKIGEPIAEFSEFPGNYLVSPTSGNVSHIETGLKRTLLTIVVQKEEKESFFEHKTVHNHIDQNNIISFLGSRGLLAHFSSRPFGLPVNPHILPEKIFINFSENLPFFPPYSEQVKCLSGSISAIETLKAGIDLVCLITKSKPELVYRQENQDLLPPQIENLCNLSVVEGPYPSGESSVHIHKIHPIKTIKDTIWTINFYDLLTIGYMVLTGKYLNKKIIGLGGNGFSVEDRLFVKVLTGSSIRSIVKEKYFSHEKALITGSPLTGRKIKNTQEFLGFRDFNISCFPINTQRKSFYFIRLGINQYTLTNTYLYKIFHSKHSSFAFTTNLHGEKRNLIDSDLYNRFMPMKIPVLPLIKAILAENFEQAILFGLLEIIPEDFALSSFVCPSKTDFINIVKNGIENFLLQES